MSAKAPALNSSITFAATQNAADADRRCTAHRKRLKFFCSKHELLLCSVCAVKQHNGCGNVLTINEAADDKAQEGKTILNAHAQTIALIENAIVERKAAKKLMESNVQEIMNEIHDLAEKMIDLVKHEQRSLVESVQTKQKNEAELLDRDIQDLEISCDKARHAHESLLRNLKGPEIDLIYCVLKEKQNTDTGDKFEKIVKKNFREVDFKFIVSPHITSFLRHFKTLGQVRLSEDSGTTSRVPRSATSTPVNKKTTPAVATDISTSGDTPTGSDKELNLSVKEKWQRERLKQMQAKMRDRHGDRNELVFRFDVPDQVNSGQRRRQLPMRAFHRQQTPEKFVHTQLLTPRREIVPRPASTPPVESAMFHSSPKSKDVDRFTNHYPAHAHSESDRHAYESSATVEQQNGAREGTIHHSEPVYVFNKRRAAQGHYNPSENRSPSPWGAPQRDSSEYSVITVKEDDTGRSFAAVQINHANPQISPHHQNGYPGRNRPSSPKPQRQEWPTSHVTSQRRLPNETQTRDIENEQHQQLNETGRFTPSQLNPPRAPSEAINRRWVHKCSFTTRGMGSKKLISGIGLLGDGRVVVVDQERYVVQLYDQNFQFISEMKLDSRPFDVIVDDENRIVVSLQSERVLKFVLIAKAGLIEVADLCVPCDLVCYGVGRGGGRYCVCCGEEVWVLSEKGRVIQNLKKDKNGGGLFFQAEYACMNDDGDAVYVSDAGNNSVIAVHLDGRRKWEFGYDGFKPAGLTFIDQYLYVCDRDQHRVLMLNVDGQVVKQSVIGRFEDPRAICLNATGDLMFLSQMRYDVVGNPANPVHVYELQ